ncbi:phosphoadenosine phosphosulfate reductase family protein, partial [Rhizobium ruizarguesonis]
TLSLIDETESQYDIHIHRFEPEKAYIDAYAAQYGLNGFYEIVEARHACCGVRKLKPLARALEGGVRRRIRQRAFRR